MGPFLRTNANNAAGTPQSGLHGRFDDSARPHLRPEYVDLALDIATISP